MGNFGQLIASDIRLAILRALEQDPAYSHNEGVLRSLLGQIGHNISHDRLRTELAWLEEQGLINVMDAGGVKVARLTVRGEDVALGRITVPGVHRPGPRDE